MGYDISSITVQNADGFGVFAADLPVIPHEELPDSWCGALPPLEPDVARHPWATDEAGFARLVGHGAGPPRFPWHDDWSGNAFDLLRDRILPAFKGYAELFITWADGDTFSALRCDNGKVTEHDVVMALGARR